jgi:DNA ligase-1
MKFSDISALCGELSRTPGRLAKVDLVARLLSVLDAPDAGTAVAFLSGHPLPVSDPRVLEVSGTTLARLRGETAGGGAVTATLTLADVRGAFEVVADLAGSGSRALKLERLRTLFAAATEVEREWLARVLFGEMRTGVSEGLLLEAIAAAWGADLALVRRAAMFLGDPAAVAELAARGGAEALDAVAPRLHVPLLPMLAEIATEFAPALAAHGGTSALEYKYDGARIQVHVGGDRVSIWSRRLSDVTASLPDVVAAVRSDLRADGVILDGEVVALGEAGRPLPFQDLMRRFRRVHDVEALVAEIPLALHFFDCVMLEGESLIDDPYARRWEALARVTHGRHLAARRVISSPAEGDAFLAEALAAGHEGVMAKDLRSAYSPGGRGKRWFKVKAPATIDCVIVAADRGSGRRVGWLSNYHLAVRDGDGFADVGKTFKGLTDVQFDEMTRRLRELAVGDDGYTVRVRPEVVVEIEYNDIQQSPRYASGLALRFARIARIREDKAPGQAITLEELRGLFERQFATKSRMLQSAGRRGQRRPNDGP